MAYEVRRATPQELRAAADGLKFIRDRLGIPLSPEISITGATTTAQAAAELLIQNAVFNPDGNFYLKLEPEVGISASRFPIPRAIQVAQYIEYPQATIFKVLDWDGKERAYLFLGDKEEPADLRPDWVFDRKDAIPSQVVIVRPKVSIA